MAPRIDFMVEDFSELVSTKGMNVAWEQATKCECQSIDTGQPDFNCPICHGAGFRYLPPKHIRVVVSSFQSNVKLESLGVREPGTAYATPDTNVIMGFRDRLIFTDFKCKFSEVFYFENNASQRSYRDILEMQYLLQGENWLEEGVDFEITKDRYHLRLLSDNVDTTKGVSALYLTRPSYLVADLLHELRATLVEKGNPVETFKEFPKQYKIVREDFVYGYDKAEDGASTQNAKPTIIIRDEVIEITNTTTDLVNSQYVVDKEYTFDEDGESYDY